MLVRNAVGPLAQRRLNEALGLAIGLRSIRSPEEMFELQLTARRGKALGMERRAVVGQHPAYGHAKRREMGDARAQKRDRRELALIGLHLREADARVIVDRDEQELPAGAGDRVAWI